MSKLLETLKSYGYEPESIGDKYRMPCIFHKENDPSMVIYPETDSFYCFGCQKWGSAIDIVMEKDNIGFKDAVNQVHGEGYEFRKLKEPIKQVVPVDDIYSLQVIAKHVKKRIDAAGISDALRNKIFEIALKGGESADTLFNCIKEVKSL